MAITRHKAQKTIFFLLCVNHILLISLVSVFPFIWILEKKIPLFGNNAITLLLFNINFQSLGVYHLAKILFKYGQKFLGQNIIISGYRHFIIT